MSESALVSIIVPVYGVETYLPDCVDSLLNQTYKNLEIILVDDESPDHCGDICDCYAKLDCRIKVIHKQNGGAASARNAGIDAATGDYICFVDSDDVVQPTYVQRLYNELHSTQADVAVCGFSIMTRTSNNAESMEPAGLYTAKDYLKLFLDHWTCSLAVNKLFKRERINDIRYVEGHRIDDEFFTYKLILRGEKVVVFNDPLYCYRQRKSSVMKNDIAYREKMLMDKVEYIIERVAFISAEEPTLANAFLYNAMDSLVRIWRQCKEMPSVKREIDVWKKQNFSSMIKMRMPLKQKMALFKNLFFAAPGNAIYNDIPLAMAESFFD